ncbi:hypothetical protein [Cellulomonas humilata]|uniref:Uncharacterized protein n=1 Tax=Cellulomonas humilata TaxID=144055 RepID=A0ABU0EGB5_9CELL|nr:hypothetical protein [Cellulomonas humilata]MDQ0373852.1 hypothetical protein [Cellulomonas humilata]
MDSAWVDVWVIYQLAARLFRNFRAALVPPPIAVLMAIVVNVKVSREDVTRIPAARVLTSGISTKEPTQRAELSWEEWPSRTS